jgi:DNA-binding transcriptional ArsR family regulator
MRASAVENVGELNASESRLRAMSHPVRRAMLRQYIETGPIAPVEVANAIGVDLSKASYHSRILVELGFLELVSTEQVRGSTKHFYRATERHLIDNRSWTELDQDQKEGALVDGMQPIIDDFTSAVRAGTFDDDGRFHITRTPIRALDQDGLDELLAAHLKLFDETSEIERRAAERMAASGEDSISVSTAQTCFVVDSF